MHTVEMVKEAIGLARRAGYRIRQEYLGDSLGGGCEFGGQKWIFLDISLGPADQLDQILEALRHDPHVVGLPMHEELRRQIGIRRSA